MFPNHLLPIPDHDQYFRDPRIAKALDDIAQDRLTANLYHRLRYLVGQFSHTGAASRSEDDRLRHGFAHACLDPISATNSAILSIASLSLSRPVAKQQRTKPSPETPKALPGTTAILLDLSS